MFIERATKLDFASIAWIAHQLFLLKSKWSVKSKNNFTSFSIYMYVHSDNGAAWFTHYKLNTGLFEVWQTLDNFAIILRTPGYPDTRLSEQNHASGAFRIIGSDLYVHSGLNSSVHFVCELLHIMHYSMSYNVMWLFPMFVMPMKRNLYIIIYWQ